MSEIARHLDAAAQLLATAHEAVGAHPAQRVAAVDLADRAAAHLKQAYSLINTETTPRTVPCQEAGALPRETQALFEFRQSFDTLVPDAYTRGISTDDEDVAPATEVKSVLDRLDSFLEVGQAVYNDGECIRNTRKVNQIKSEAGLAEP